MASSSALTSLLLLFSLLSLLSIGAHARPCKSLFISYTVSPHTAAASGASTIEIAQISSTGYRTPSGFFAIYRLIPLRYYHRYSYSYSASATEPLATSLRLPVGIHRPALPRPVARPEPSFGVISLRERAKDILVLVAGLLVGVGCGALTSATMYLAWSLFNNRYEVCGSDYYDDGVAEVESPKKMGYADLPAAPATPVAPLKEGYEGN